MINDSCSIFGVAGATFLSWNTIENLIAIALPEAEVLEKLDPVPVFSIVDEQGAPLVASGEDEANKMARVFISQYDANEFVNQLKTENSELAEKVRVVSVSLGDVYKLAGSAENVLNFAYIPEELAVAEAEFICYVYEQPCKNGQVPLFVARGGEDKGYLTFERNSQQVIPFFFDKKQLEEMVARFKEKEPGVATSVDIEVHSLEAVIKVLETNSDEIIKKIVLIPSPESIRFLESHSASADTRRQDSDSLPKQAEDIAPWLIEQWSLLESSQFGF